MGRSIPRAGETMEQCLARRRAEWASNAEVQNAQRREAAVQKAEEVNARRRASDELNREKIRVQLRASYRRNAAARKATAVMNHYLRKLRVPSWAELDAILEFYKNCPEGHEVDHEIPLLGERVSGLHVMANLQYLPMCENRAKRNKYEVI